jgi:sugar phosphate isomerase/epimerase
MAKGVFYVCAIRIGTCVKSNDFFSTVSEISKYEFESIQLYCSESLGGFDLSETSKVLSCLTEHNLKLNSIGLYGNPIEDKNLRDEIIKCLKVAPSLGIKVLSTFTGSLGNGPVESSLPLFKKYFSEFLCIAKDNDVKIAIENYPGYGFWYNTKQNIGFCPRA